jgi:serine phosphatase RsbU (regulator of sigma subunit)
VEDQTPDPDAREALGRLAAVIAGLQAELADVRSRATAEAVIQLATGVLMERLGGSPADARAHLARLADQAGTPLVALAADVAGQPVPAALPPQTVPAAGTGAPPPPQGPCREQATAPVRAATAAQMADDASGVAEAVLAEGLAPHGAIAVALWALEPDGALQLAGQAGLDSADVSRWHRLPPHMDCLPQRAVRDGRARWLPAGRGAALLVRRAGARAAVPLTRAGAVVGVMEVCWPHPLDRFTIPLQQQILALAEVGARGLAAPDANGLHRRMAWLPALLDGLAAPVIVAHAVRAADGGIVDFLVDYVGESFPDPAGRGRATLRGRRLLQLYPLLAVPGGLFDRAVEVAATGRPHHAERAVVRVRAGADEVAVELTVRIARLFDGVVISWTAAGQADQTAALLEHTQRLGQIGGWHQDLLTGEARWSEHTFTLLGYPADARPVPLEDLDARVHPDDVAGVARFRERLLVAGREAAVAFRLTRPDGVIRQVRAFAEPVTDPSGTVVAVRGAYQDVSAQYHTQLALAATQVQLTSTEKRAEDSHQIALRLQQAIMPASASPVESAGLDLVVRYRPADEDHRVGGDWYDAVALPSSAVFLAVGDIAGHSIEAVTGMIALRNSLRGLAVTGAGPGQLLSWLNSIAYHTMDNITASVVCGLFDPVARVLRWAHAGHPPPILVRDGTAQTLPQPQGVLLGALPDTAFEEATTSLQTGDRLLLFTDGLIERRGTAVTDALDALLRLAAHPGPDIDRFADHLLHNAVSDTDDDTCLIAIQMR